MKMKIKRSSEGWFHGRGYKGFNQFGSPVHRNKRSKACNQRPQGMSYYHRQ